MHVTALSIYPIKSIAGVAAATAEVRPRGLAGDRRWVVVDADGICITQREHPRLALVRAVLGSESGLRVRAPDRDPLDIAAPQEGARLLIGVWDDRIDAADAGEEAAAWFSEFLDCECRLAFMDEAAVRPVRPEYAGDAADVVSFADALPLLLASESSLGDLNWRLANSASMSRFRPNVVIDGDRPWAEDDWKRIRIGSVEFEGTHPCARCVMTTVDPVAGELAGDGEPLKTLATFRRGADGGVLFGLNLAPRSLGVVRVGDEVEVLA